ncbi:MAG: hypothetical protein ACR2OA_20720 [Rubripirellula sp.]
MNGCDDWGNATIGNETLDEIADACVGLWENSSRERGWNWNIAGDVSLLLRAQQVVVPMLTVAEAVKQTYKQ